MTFYDAKLKSVDYRRENRGRKSVVCIDATYHSEHFEAETPERAGFLAEKLRQEQEKLVGRPTTLELKVCEE
jgi:hypothetical protein